MKRIRIFLTGLVLAALFVLTFALSACTGNNFTVATNAFFAPFEYKEGKNFVGIDMEIAQIIADEMNLKLKVKDMEFDSVLIAVQNGTCDIAMAGLTVTEKRQESVDFCQSYFNASQMVISKKDDTALNDSMTDEQVLNALTGKRIGVVMGFTGQFFVEGDEEFGFDGIKDVIVKTYMNGSTAVADLIKTGSPIDYVIIDNVPAKYLVNNYASSTKLINVPLTEEEYAFAVKKGNSDLLATVNGVLTKIKDNGKLEEIINKYFI